MKLGIKASWYQENSGVGILTCEKTNKVRNVRPAHDDTDQDTKHERLYHMSYKLVYWQLVYCL